MRRSPLAAISALLIGVVLTLFGCAPVTGSPLYAIVGIGGIVAGSLMFVCPRDAPGTAASRLADPCQWGNHAGCLDSPDCICGCHRERVELRLPSL